MHPAKSVIAFTTMSGAGYGLLIATLLGQLFGLYETTMMISVISLVLAFILISVGLLMSTLHLGHPERAWRALSQWRSSWLSREGICSILTFIPWLIYVVASFFVDATEVLILWSGILTVILALLTVFTTSMIYRSLKPIQSWYNAYVTPLYLTFSLATGLTLLNLILFLNQYPSAKINNIALLALIGAVLLKNDYWRYVDNAERRSTIESATGLGSLGKVQALEHPHQHQNYLMKEMGFQIARKHSNKLRRLFMTTWLVAVMSLGLAIVFTGSLAQTMAIVGCLMMIIGIVVERWLFFAEAKHDQALFYGQG